MQLFGEDVTNPAIRKKRRRSVSEEESRLQNVSKIQILNTMKAKKHQITSQVHSKCFLKHFQARKQHTNMNLNIRPYYCTYDGSLKRIKRT